MDTFIIQLKNLTVNNIYQPKHINTKKEHKTMPMFKITVRNREGRKEVHEIAALAQCQAKELVLRKYNLSKLQYTDGQGGQAMKRDIIIQEVIEI